MKRELCAGLLLLLLVAAAVYSLNRMDRLIGLVEAPLSLSEAAAARGDYDEALSQFERALNLWEGSRRFTDVLLPHAELDEAREIFYELMTLLLQQDAQALPACYRNLSAQLEHISYMEHLSVGTVL